LCKAFQDTDKVHDDRATQLLEFRLPACRRHHRM